MNHPKGNPPLRNDENGHWFPGRTQKQNTSVTTATGVLEDVVRAFEGRVQNPELSTLFQNRFLNTVETTVELTTSEGEPDAFVISANHTTNFAQNFPLTVPRQTVPDALTDVYFNDDTAALPTTPGQDLTVRGVNFAAGAAGPVSVGGVNTLTLNAGGITVQAGTGSHSTSANVALGSEQTWGNVSASPFTVSGVVSGAHALTIVGACTIQAPVSASGSATVNQTYSGTGPIVLLGANTYGGGTTISSGTLVVGNTSGSGTGSGGVSVAAGGTLTNNETISGSVTLGGNAGGNGIYGGAVTVGSGAIFSAAGTVDGPLTAASGGLVALSGNSTLNADGVVTMARSGWNAARNWWSATTGLLPTTAFSTS